MNRAWVFKSFFFSAVFLTSGFQTRASEASTPPKLAVVIVVDQMRADHLSRFAGLYKGGFKRLLDRGAVFTNAHHEHHKTDTGPGHATIAAGSHPSRHGIVANSWFDRDEKKLGAFGYGEDSSYPPLGYPNRESREGRSPVKVLVPALGDWLKTQSPNSKVFSISRKSGSAVMMAGKKPDAAYWYNSDDGHFITSEYYLKAYPAWVVDFNESRVAERFFEPGWKKLMPSETYFLAREDSFAAENYGKKSTFPHNFESTEPDTQYYRALRSTPFADAFILEFAKTLVENENLGTDESPDLLFVGCSAADAVGHTFGPLSQESLDHFLRLDIYLEEFLDFLDQQIGSEHYIVALSSDHGALPLVEDLARRGFDAKRIPEESLLADIEEIFIESARHLEIDEPLMLVIPRLAPEIYVNYAAAESNGISARELNRLLIPKLKQLDLVVDVLSREELTQKKSNGRPYFYRYENGYHPGRSGDLILRFKEFYTLGDIPTLHSSPYTYDSHVPIVFMGAGIKAGFHSQKARTVDIAPTFAEWLDVNPTIEIDGRSLVGAIQAE